MKKFPRSLAAPSGAESMLAMSKLLVCFIAPKSSEEAAAIFQNLNLVLVTSEKRFENERWNTINNTPTRFWVRTADGQPITDAQFANIETQLAGQVEWIGPVYETAGYTGAEGCFCPIPDVVLISKKTKSAKLATIVKENGLSLDEKRSKYLSGFNYFKAEPGKAAAVFEVQRKLVKSGNTVIFENMPMFKPTTATIPNDPWWGSQWDMAQINAPAAWDIEQGRPSVVICILDEGVDLGHPDLQFSEQGINLGTMMPPGSPTGAHGTACAGIAAATINNNQGIAGVAPGCRIMPLAFQNWSDIECAIGINYATANGAAVISMSFGVYDHWGWDYNLIDPEIQNAFNNNVVMCVAAGNENDGTMNRYPGKHPLVICVGGSSTDDNRKTPWSPDGEGWGASYGEQYYNGVLTGLSVVAPCVLCPTTDILSWGGYSSDDYMPNFNGTSAATPHVAGLAGLIKSQNQSLTNVQVRDIIEKTAAKVGSLPYADRAEFPNGGRNQEMGYGRIDVLAALSYAQPASCCDLKIAAKLSLMEMANGKFNHLKSHADCPDFADFSNPNGGQPAKLQPCFYLHWGDSNSDTIETEDFEVVILSAGNPFNNVEFRGVTLTEIEVVHADGSPIETLPDGTPAALLVPSRLVHFTSVAPASCSNIELVVKTSGALSGNYKIKFNCCVEEVKLTAGQGDLVGFDIELMAA